MEEDKTVKDSIAMAIGSIILIIMLFWGFSAFGSRVVAEEDATAAFLVSSLISFLLLFGTLLFLSSLASLGEDYDLAGILAMCVGAVILIIILLWGFLFSDIGEFNLELVETILMTPIGTILLLEGGFYLGKHRPLASSLTEIIGFVIVLVALSFWAFSILELWKAGIMTLSGFCLIFGGFFSFFEKREGGKGYTL
jgi:hypothetical protein